MPVHFTVTASTIATHTGLSRATVTHVLNGRAEQMRIRPETRERVLKAARELGYRPNASARALQTGRFGNVALIQSLRAAYLPGSLLMGLSKALVEYNTHLTVAEAPESLIDDEAYLPKVMRELSADGLIINRIIRLPEPFIQRVKDLHTPAVFLNVKHDHDAVHPDDFAGGQMAVQHLVEFGHTRILYVYSAVNEPEHYSEIDRRAGYEAAMHANGLKPQCLRLPADPTSPQEALHDARIEVARAFLYRAAPPPTAVVTYELAEAMAVTHAVHQLGMRIPGDLSLVMFHTESDTRFCMPITVVSNNMSAVGAEAVHMIMEKIEKGEVTAPTRVVPMRLLPGGTCTAPRRN